MRKKINIAILVAVLVIAVAGKAGLVPVILMAGPFFMDSGKAICSNLVSGLGGTVPKYAAMGTGAGPADSTATALTTEVETRSGTNAPTRVTTTVTNDTVQVVNTVTATATRVITECGLFDAATTGNSLIMSGISTINLANGDSIQFTYKLKFA
jgi:hypothetical protein